MKHLSPWRKEKGATAVKRKWCHIKGLSIPSQPLAKVRSDKDNKINIFGILLYRLENKDCKIK